MENRMSKQVSEAVPDALRRGGDTVAVRGFTKHDTACVKGIAILLMIIHHCFLGPDRYAGQVVDFAPFSEHRFNSIALSFKICVALFVFISGYGIAYSYKKTDRITADIIKRVTARRMVSLLGGFMFVFMLAQLWSLAVVHDGRYLKVYGKGILGVLYFLLDLFGLAELFRTPTFLATFWYMSLAILIVLSVPVLVCLGRRWGYFTVFCLAVYFRVLFEPTSDATYAYLPNYLACLTAGVWCAESDAFTRACRRLGTFDVCGVALRALVVAMGVGSLYLRQKTRATSLLPIWDSVIPFLLCLAVCDWVSRLTPLTVPLAFLGKHSMNIFLVHNFVRIMWYYDFTYSFEKWWLIVAVLLGVSIVISLCIEALKRVTRYNDLLVRLREVCG